MRKNLLAFTIYAALPTAVVAGPPESLASVEVLPGWRGPNGEHVAGLRITLEPGWKTYWRAPGDAGIPPRFSFQGSENIATVLPHWPVPEVFNQAGMRSVGYHENIVFPLTVQSVDPEAPMQISGQLDIGICEEICIPISLQFSSELPAEGDRDSAIVAALIDRPLSKDEAGVGAVTCAIAPISDGLRMTAHMDVASTGTTEFVVIETADPHVWVSEAEVNRNGNQLSATVDMIHHSGAVFALDRSTVNITVLGSDQAIEIQGCNAG